jgi:hypothetical protein
LTKLIPAKRICPIAKILQTKHLCDNICNKLSSLEPDVFRANLESLESLLCASFQSKHRHVVDSMAVIWNLKMDDDSVVGLKYPERLKAVVISTRAFVDLSIPGLAPDTPVDESDGQHHSFITSQGHVSALMSLPKSSGRRDRRISINQQPPSSSPSVVKLSLSAVPLPIATPTTSHSKHQQRLIAPRLRHEDSQIQFAPIESSPIDAGSQALTERQLETRERQKANATFFPEISSSPRSRPRSLSSLRKQSPHLPLTDTASQKPEQTTPQPSARYEDFINSTPTPRRGQALTIDDNDHEMTDPPSSPPEPRPFPLLPAIKSRSSSTSSIMDNWEFSSSPVSGSPIPSHQIVAGDEPPHLALSADTPSHLQQPDGLAIAGSFVVDIVPSSVPSGSVPDGREQFIAHDIKNALAQPVKDLDTNDAGSRHPSTPPRNYPIEKAQETPRSDNDIFEDALSTPQLPTPRVTRSGATAALLVSSTAQRQGKSKVAAFGQNDSDEANLFHLVVELDSRKCSMPFQSVTSSPVEKLTKAVEPEVLDCITVQTEPSKSNRIAKKKNISLLLPSTPTQNQHSDISTSIHGSEGGEKKRKRAYSKAERGRKKKKFVGHEVAVLTSNPQIIEHDGIQQSAEDSPRTGIPTPHEELARLESLSQNNNDEAMGMHNSRSSSRRSSLSTGESNKSSEDTDIEIQSQLVAEQEAASHGLTPTCEPSLEILEGLPGNGIVSGPGPISKEYQDLNTDQLIAIPSSPLQENTAMLGESNTVCAIMDLLRGGLEQLRSAALSREEVYQMEDVFMDLKRELYEAERRGRNQAISHSDELFQADESMRRG